MSANNETTHIRIKKRLLEEMNQAFPNINKSELLNIAWDTSLVKCEAKLKSKDFKNKFGKILWGNMYAKK